MYPYRDRDPRPGKIKKAEKGKNPLSALYGKLLYFILPELFSAFQ